MPRFSFKFSNKIYIILLDIKYRNLNNRMKRQKTKIFNSRLLSINNKPVTSITTIENTIKNTKIKADKKMEFIFAKFEKLASTSEMYISKLNFEKFAIVVYQYNAAINHKVA